MVDGKLWNIRFKFHYVTNFFLVLLIFAVVYLTFNNEGIMRVKNSDVACSHKDDKSLKSESIITSNIINEEETDPRKEEGCDLFSGRWVYDNLSSPLYKDIECSFMEEDFACEKYGRKDLKYQNLRWQPHHCDLPRFNGTAFLEKIRGKKIIFIGDSLIRNQRTSMLCLIESSLPPMSSRLVVQSGSLFVYEAQEYNASIGFYWSPFLVESNNDNPFLHRLQDRVLRIKSIENHARHWNDADILVFDSFMWWICQTMTILLVHHNKLNKHSLYKITSIFPSADTLRAGAYILRWGSFGSSDAIYNKMEMRPRLYEMALNTWSDWLEFNINRTKTKLFFMGVSPYHEVGEDWDKEQNCYGATEPISDEGYWGFTTNRDLMHIAESTIQKLETRGVKVRYLNITQMSDYRRDAHPSVYRKFYHNISEEQLRDPRSYSDCVHWCLPGLPDVWNQILYAYIMNS